MLICVCLRILASSRIPRYDLERQTPHFWGGSVTVCRDDSNAFRLEHGTKVTFFDCHRKFLPLSHEFRGDKQLFQKGKTVRKGPPKRKLGANIVKMLDGLKESENGGFKGYDKKHNWTHKSYFYLQDTSASWHWQEAFIETLNNKEQQQMVRAG
jgi:hypothetical protein